MEKRTIVVVDDEEQILRALSRELQDWLDDNGINIFTTTSPSECLEYLKTATNVSIVISDLRMPEMTGGDLLLKIHERYPSLALVLLTAYQDIQEIQKAVSASISTLIMKPWDHTMLIKELERILKYKETEQENIQIRKELEYHFAIAGEFQRKMLRSPLPENSSLDIEVDYRPVPQLQCGGDYYDLIPLKQDKLLVLLGDVAGHGLRAAFVTPMLKTLTSELRDSYDSLFSSPSTVLQKLNQNLCKALENIDGIIISFTALIIDPVRRELSFSNAGHLPVYHLKNDKVYSYTLPGSAIGFMKSIDYIDKTVALEKGDRIVVFTDGLVESIKHRQLYSEEEISEVLINNNKQKEFCESVINDFSKERPSGTLDDDITLISVVVK